MSNNTTAKITKQNKKQNVLDQIYHLLTIKMSTKKLSVFDKKEK